MYARVLYPNVAGFGAQRFLDLKEPELMLECVRAYNDFLYDWTSPAPERFVNVCAVPFWDLDETLKEIERLIGRTSQRGLTLVPTRIYFKGPWAKVELALARGKEGRDRRREMRDRDMRREIDRELRHSG